MLITRRSVSSYTQYMPRSDTSNTKNGPFPSSPGPLFQNEGRCSAFDMEIVFHFHANKTHFHKKGCAPSFILKVRVFGTRKWPFVIWPQLCKSWMALSTGEITIQWIRIRETNCSIQWIVIYPMDCVIRLLNNRGLISKIKR